MNMKKIFESDLKKAKQIKAAIQELKRMVSEEELALNLDENESSLAEKTADILLSLCNDHMASLEAHMDDLQSEGEE